MSAATSGGAETAKKSDWARVNVAAFLFNFCVVAAGRLSFLGKNNRVVSNAHPTLLTPAGWVMKIWIVIFVSELIFVVWQARSIRGRSDAVTKGVGPWFAAACVAQAFWNMAFAQELILLSAVLLPLISACLTTALVRLAPYREGGALALMSSEYWLLHFPIGLHAGWSTTASLVLINMTLESQPLSTRVTALLISMVVAPLAAAFASFAYHGEPYLCAVAWGMASIADKGDFRRETLPAAVADGVDRAFSALSLALVVFGTIGLCFQARGTAKGAVGGGGGGEGAVAGGGVGGGEMAAAKAHEKGE